MTISNPCLSCGACCAFYRASFYWSEADDATAGGVPVCLTEKLNDFRRIMIGTNAIPPRCIALKGEIGNTVFCSVYKQRPSVCREFESSWINGKANERCDKARAEWGMLPLEPDIWNSPNNFKKAA
jgi:Fe-S-cluster containining protein